MHFGERSALAGTRSACFSGRRRSVGAGVAPASRSASRAVAYDGSRAHCLAAWRRCVAACNAAIVLTCFQTARLLVSAKQRLIHLREVVSTVGCKREQPYDIEPVGRPLSGHLRP